MLLGVGIEQPAYSPFGDSARRRIVGMVLFVYVLLIVEGVLRKWLLPELSRALFFVRDPFVLGVYVMAIASGHWPRTSPWLNVALLLALLSSALAMVQVALGIGNLQSPVIFAAYGLRNYFFYIPLAFIIADTFRAEDFYRVAAITFALVTVSAGVVVLQFYAPVDSPINVGSSDNILLQFRGLGLNERNTRPMGMFTSDVGQKQLAVSALAMVLAGWSGALHRGSALRLLLPVATVAVLTCLAFSGSRGAILSAGLVMMAALVAVARGGTSVHRGRILGVIAGLCVVAAALTLLFFTDGIAAFLGRWSSAQDFESQQFSGGIFGRALYGFIDFARLMSATPLTGYGVGMGGNAAIMAATNAGETLQYSAEPDWARHVVDLGPVLGLLFIGFRVSLVLALARRVLASRSVLAMLLLGYLAYELLLGQITGQGTINGYVWMFTGFTLAAAGWSTHPVPVLQGASPQQACFPNLMR